MRQRVPWHVKGVHPNARVSAREAARRSGMSVGEWLNSVILDSAEEAEPEYEPDYPAEDEHNASPAPRSRRPAPRGYGAPDPRDYDRRERDYDYRAPEPRYAPEPPRYARDPIADEVSAIHDRLEGLTAGVENLMRSTSLARGGTRQEDDGTSRRLSDAISKLDQRVEHLMTEGRTATRAMERRVDSVDRALSILGNSRAAMATSDWSPAAGFNSGIDQSVAEISMRQRELDGEVAPGRPRPVTPEARIREELARHDFAGVEDKLRYITDQIDALGPGRMNDSLSALRNDLADIARTLTEASPRRAIEALEGEIRVLSSRIDTRSRGGANSPALATLEQGLTEVRDTLRGLTPAENLAGAVDAIHALSGKIDQMAGSHQQDPAALEHLETAIAGLRSIVSHVASNDALSALTHEVRALSERVDQNAGGSSQGNDILRTLEGRIANIADAIEQLRSSGGRNSSPDIDNMVRTLGDKIESLRTSRNEGADIGQLDSRISQLVQKLEASESRLGNLDAIERGMKELMGYLLEIKAGGGIARAAAPAPAPQEIVREVRRNEESLEAVHDTIGNVVDRLAMIETGMRNNPDRPAAPAGAPRPAPQPQYAPQHAAQAAPPMQPQRPPQQAPQHAPMPQAQPAAAAASYSMQARPPEMPRAAQMAAASTPAPQPPRQAVAQQMRPAADGTLPYDFPLEPGSGKPRPGMVTPVTGGGVSSPVAAFRSPADRIRASLETSAPHAAAPAAPAVPTAAQITGNDQPKSNFIEAARRAAQFAAESQIAAGVQDAKHAPDVEPAPVSLMGRVRKHAKSVLIGASVLILIAAGIHTAVNFFGLNEQEPEAAAPKPQSSLATPDSIARLTPPRSFETGSGQLTQPNDPFSMGDTTGSTPSVSPSVLAQSPSAPPQIAAPMSGAVSPEITGAVPRKLTPPPAGLFAGGNIKAAVLPPSIGGRTLVAAAEAGDAAAAFEIAVRYSEGRGVPTNLEESAVWFERAARSGLTPAIFRLGGLYEKGIGVKKDVKRAHALYVAAADRGNAKSMHNLAVLYAVGGEGKPDYPNALVWFRKAADRGIADSQFNLGVLYARGIGMEANLAESYKWFALAAQGGDRDAGQKRDDVAKRLDAQTFAAAKNTVQQWTPVAQPEEAISVQTPPGGWDQALPAAAKAKAKPATPGKRADAR